MTNKLIQKRLGFTLIELLVVIAIIGLLASVVLVSLNTSRRKARDATRKSAISEVRKALELYSLDNNGVYPNGGTVGTPNNETDIQNLASFLVPTYLSALPNDPLDSTGANYGYVWRNSGRDWALYVPFGNESGGTSCVIKTPNGQNNWFGSAPNCTF